MLSIMGKYESMKEEKGNDDNRDLPVTDRGGSCSQAAGAGEAADEI